MKVKFGVYFDCWVDENFDVDKDGNIVKGTKYGGYTNLELDTIKGINNLRQLIELFGIDKVHFRNCQVSIEQDYDGVIRYEEEDIYSDFCKRYNSIKNRKGRKNKK